jgi:hypothetical protein
MPNPKTEALQLLGRLPVAPGYKLPLGADEKNIAEAENWFGFALPKELRDWLRHCNGPCVGPGGLLGVGTPNPAFDIQRCVAGHPGWAEHKFLPVAGDGCGNYYVIAPDPHQSVPHPVVLVDTIHDPLAPSYVVGSDLWHFLRFLFLRELGRSKWPFAREEVCATDPKVLNVSIAPFPWDRARNPNNS